MVTGGQKPKNYQSNGTLIMQIAEEVIRPYLMKKLADCRDENGMPVQPARIRGIALIMAQEWVKYYQGTVH